MRIHDVNGKVIDTASVNVELKNKIPRSNPAPGVRLVNNLPFGAISTYSSHAEVQLFEVVSSVGLPILGGLGLIADSKVIQSVEDVRPNGDLLLRYRMAKGAFVSAYGTKHLLFADQTSLPQLYRLMDKYGNVITRNVFTKQAKYTIMDVVPILPGRAVKEGDSWPSEMQLIVDGLMSINLSGTSMLDSFEWQNGQQCAKIISQMTCGSSISVANGKIRSMGAGAKAQVVTYFAYKSGKMLLRQLTINFPATIDTGISDSDFADTALPAAAPTVAPKNPFAGSGANMDDEDDNGGPVRSPGGPIRGGSSSADSGLKKGSAQISVVLKLEK